MSTRKPRPASEAVKRRVAESSIPGSDSNRLDEVEGLIEAENAQRTLLNLRLKAVEDRIEKLKTEQVALCPHTDQEQTSDYYGGSYDEVARTFYKIACKRCGKTLKTWDKAHNYYG